MSKGLEALEQLGNETVAAKDRSTIFMNGTGNNSYTHLIQVKNINKTCYETIEKELNALEIIKNKCVNVNTLINSIIGAIEPLEFYNEKVSENLKLTQQEYELLREMLCNDK